MRRGSVVLSAGGAVIVLVAGVLTLARVLPAPADHTPDQIAFLGLWRLFAGTVMLVSAGIQAWKKRVGGAIAAVFGAFEIFVNVESRDVLQGPFIPLAAGPVLVLVGGMWALFGRRARPVPRSD